MALKPLIIAALGSRGTGKSAWVRQLLQHARPRRLVLWDLMREDQHAWVGPGSEDLGATIRAMQAPAFSLRFWPSRTPDKRAAQFDLFCRACLAAGRLVVYVEELAFVTTAHKAPDGWRELSLLGRHPPHEATLIGTSQRPAQVDKDFLGNADLVHCGRLGEAPDARRVAGRLGVDYRELLTLPDLHWIERTPAEIEPRRGVLTFDKAPARRTPGRRL